VCAGDSVCRHAARCTFHSIESIGASLTFPAISRRPPTVSVRRRTVSAHRRCAPAHNRSRC